MPETDKKFQLWLKYAFDKLMAIFALLITAPIFLVVALILKFQGEDVFFLQKRLGKGGNEFWVYKFTTMPKGSEKLGLITTTNDPRPTKFGKFLR
ncbi:MAG: sugar transferase, partial [Methanobacteriota archaeon]